MTERQARDEGAAQTKIIMEAVRRHRAVKRWSAIQLADEMTAAGVPWNESTVANLESGRRKSLRVHELLALAYVLDVSPPDLLVPEDPEDQPYPVTPSLLLSRPTVQDWTRGKTGPLRALLEQAREGEAADLAAVLGTLTPWQRHQIMTLLARPA